jgi:hypothetical protein
LHLGSSEYFVYDYDIENAELLENRCKKGERDGA